MPEAAATRPAGGASAAANPIPAAAEEYRKEMSGVGGKQGAAGYS